MNKTLNILSPARGSHFCFKIFVRFGSLQIVLLGLDSYMPDSSWAIELDLQLNDNYI
jgi:hypothetical protein